MKKLTALLLALIMVFSLAMVASADETGGQGEGTQAPTHTDMSTVTITKWYKNPNNQVSPAETLKFTIKLDKAEHTGVDYNAKTQELPTVADIIFAEGDAGKVVIANGTADYKCKRDIVVTLPTYNAVGIYTYIINEDEGDTAGVTYYTDEIKLVVTVIEQDGKVRVAAVHTENPVDVNNTKGNKKDTITNVYEAGELTVNKQVTGNLGDLEKNFTVTVTFAAPANEKVGAPITYVENGEERSIATSAWDDDNKATVTIDLKHNETVTFKNIPEGVTYTVVENDYTGEGYKKADYEFSDSAKKIDGGIDGANVDSVVITNNKEAEVDTGIALDSMPFVLMLAVAVIGMGAIVIGKKRYEV